VFCSERLLEQRERTVVLCDIEQFEKKSECIRLSVGMARCDIWVPISVLTEIAGILGKWVHSRFEIEVREWEDGVSEGREK